MTTETETETGTGASHARAAALRLLRDLGKKGVRLAGGVEGIGQVRGRPLSEQELATVKGMRAALSDLLEVLEPCERCSGPAGRLLGPLCAPCEGTGWQLPAD